MGIVTQVIQHEDRDPEFAMTGIITLEDILEDLAQDDEDSFEEEAKEANPISTGSVSKSGPRLEVAKGKE